MVLVRKHVGKRQLGGPGHRWRKNWFQRNGIGECGLDLFLPGYNPETGCCKVDNELSGFKICWDFVTDWRFSNFPRTVHHWA
jgi:hypothetical protein